MRPVFGALFLVVALFYVESAAAQGNAEPGKKLWESVDARCRDCHGDKGEGGFGPDLAGRQLSFDQFKQAVRKPWGIMPAFTEQQISDADMANFLAYFGSLPKVAAPGPWKAALPAQAKHGQELIIATVGCAQCHGATLNGPRGNAGAVNADFEWFKKMVYEHTTYMPQHRTIAGSTAHRRSHGQLLEDATAGITPSGDFSLCQRRPEVPAGYRGAADTRGANRDVQPRGSEQRTCRKGTLRRRRDDLARSGARHESHEYHRRGISRRSQGHRTARRTSPCGRCPGSVRRTNSPTPSL